jgi:hypothetical protein
MKQDEQKAIQCPVCAETVDLTERGQIPAHGRRMGVGIIPCEAAHPGWGFSREWAKPVEKKRK